jgi:uncharacterized protein with PIN domain
MVPLIQERELKNYHFFARREESTFLFNIVRCPECFAPITDLNSAEIKKVNLSTLIKKYGMQSLKEAPENGHYCEELNAVVCFYCYRE